MDSSVEFRESGNEASINVSLGGKLLMDAVDNLEVKI